MFCEWKSSPYRNCMGVQLHVNQPSPMKILQAFDSFLTDPDPFFPVSTPDFQKLSKSSHFVAVDKCREANMSSVKTEKLCNVVMFEKSEKINKIETLLRNYSYISKFRSPLMTGQRILKIFSCSF